MITVRAKQFSQRVKATSQRTPQILSYRSDMVKVKGRRQWTRDAQNIFTRDLWQLIWSVLGVEFLWSFIRKSEQERVAKWSWAPCSTRQTPNHVREKCWNIIGTYPEVIRYKILHVCLTNWEESLISQKSLHLGFIPVEKTHRTWIVLQSEHLLFSILRMQILVKNLQKSPWSFWWV